MMQLSRKLTQAINRVLIGRSISGAIQEIKRVSGGDINQAAHIITDDGQFFVKWLANAPDGFFQAEAHGLRLLANARTLRVPRVIGHGEVAEQNVSFLILEWVDAGGQRSGDVVEQLGRGLAEMHRAGARQYGLDIDNYIGRLPQLNNWFDSWIDFYSEYRLGEQRNLAQSSGRLPAERARRLEYVMTHLDYWLDESISHPALIHGDLWSGNWIVSGNGEPVILDPAVYYGDREADLAMTTLFEGFPSSFYDAYQQAYPLEDGWKDREPLYHLYHLLSHLNHFGGSYGASVDRILKRYAG